MKNNKHNRPHHRQQESKFEKEQLRGKNRELIKEIKRLKRLKARMPEQSDEMDSHSEFVMDDTPNRVTKLQCPKCGGHETNILELQHRSYLICQECGYRGPLK